MCRESSFEKALTPLEWERMFTMAKQQALLGVLNDAVHRLPSEQQPPESLLSRWDSLTEKIAEIQARHLRHEEWFSIGLDLAAAY